MAHIVEHLPLDELEARYRGSQDATEARHLQAIWLLADLSSGGVRHGRERPRLCGNAIALSRCARSHRRAAGVGNDDL
jgi:hypothetical protein